MIVAPVAASLAVFARLPDPMPTHFDVHGRANGWMPRALGAFVLPGIAVLTVALVRLGGKILPAGWRERMEASPVQALAVVLAAFLAAIHVVLLRAALAPMHGIGTVALTLVGALLVTFGLLLPRTRRNPVFGVRTAFALASDENWSRTQRFGGYTMVLGGAAVTVTAIAGAPSAALAAVLASALAPVLWSWILARRGVGNPPHP